MNIYWYAPFNNAHEQALAAALHQPGERLVVQSLASRFGKRPLSDSFEFEMVRDLPDTAGDDGGRRSRGRRARIAVARAGARHRLVASRPFDIVHLHTYNPFTDPLALRMLKRRCGALVISVHNVRPHEQRVPSARLERQLLSAGYRVADQILVAHSLLADQLIRDFGVHASRVSVLPLVVPVPVRPLKPAPVDGPFLFFGTLRQNKGIDILLAAMRLIEDPSVRLHVAGRGLDQLEAAVRAAAAVDKRIIAEIGYVTPDRQDALLRGARALVLPYTNFDAQSGVLQDAYAYQRAVIASDVGALGAEVSRSGGLVIPRNDPSALAHAMTTLASNPSQLDHFQSSSASVAAQRSPTAIAGQLRALYEQFERRPTHRQPSTSVRLAT